MGINGTKKFSGTSTTPFDWETTETATAAYELEERVWILLVGPILTFFQSGVNIDLKCPSLEEAQVFSDLPPRGPLEAVMPQNRRSEPGVNITPQKPAEQEECILF